MAPPPPTTTTTNKQIHQHPSHQHPLELQQDLSDEKGNLACRLCTRSIWSKDYYYTCREGCGGTNSYYYHRACAEAPSRIDRHPLHPKHPLTLSHGIRPFTCDHCDRYFFKDSSSFRCDECDFDLDTGCALSALPDVGGSQGGKTSEQITLPIHPHPLTSFLTRHDFVGCSDCYICRESVGGDGYTCLERGLCEFVIHKRCVQDLYYADETKAPTVYHGHQMEIWVGQDDTDARTCASCGSDKPGEFIGCCCCGVFYHRQCFQVPEIITYPCHDPDHRLILFLGIDDYQGCESCVNNMKNQIHYSCAQCKLSVHIECALKVVAYVEEGMSTQIQLSWHNHRLILSHKTEPYRYTCSYCGDYAIGPTYACSDMFCGFSLHKRCTEMKSLITSPHHPDHPLGFREIHRDLGHDCQVCGEAVHGIRFPANAV